MLIKTKITMLNKIKITMLDKIKIAIFCCEKTYQFFRTALKVLNINTHSIVIDGSNSEIEIK